MSQNSREDVGMQAAQMQPADGAGAAAAAAAAAAEEEAAAAAAAAAAAEALLATAPHRFTFAHLMALPAVQKMDRAEDKVTPFSQML
jgi:hypothetical protein